MPLRPVLQDFTDARAPLAAMVWVAARQARVGHDHRSGEALAAVCDLLTTGL